MEEQPKPTRKTRRRDKGPRITNWWKLASIVSTVLLLTTILLSVAINTLVNKNPRLRAMATCRDQMEEIGGALRRYIISNDAYPDRLEKLYPDFLISRSTLRCPEDKRDPKTGPSSYTYRPPKPGDPEDTVVCSCSRHRFLATSLEIRLLKNSAVDMQATKLNDVQPKPKPKPVDRL